MKAGRVILAGLAVTIFGALLGGITCGHLFTWVYTLEPTNVWKPMDGGPGAKFLVGSCILSVVLASVYALINKGIPGGTKTGKGIVFGLCVWAVGMLPGMFATRAFMTVNPTVITYWTILGLIKSPIDGVIIAAIYGE